MAQTVKIILSEEEKSAILRAVECVVRIYHDRLPDLCEISRELKTYLKLPQTEFELCNV